MNGNQETMTPECLYRGDARVCVLLGRQNPPAAGESIRKSRFVYGMYAEGKYLLFHTLTRRLLAVHPQFIEYFAEDGLFSPSILEQDVPKALYDQFFLVPEHTPESQTYLELKDVLVLKEELPRDINHYVILPTSTCNARCFYCFEQGMQYRKMSEETVQDTLRFILRHRPKDQKEIHIHWFGGEPLCAAENIDRICAGLNEAGVAYQAEMTSNGSLFTEEMAKKAAEAWKVSRIQITLDGMAEEYARRKRYSSALEAPFDTVIRNMHLLLAAGINLTVRLNTDENNLGEIYRLVDFLREAFTAEEQKRMRVYAHSLFGQHGEGLSACPADAAADELEARVLEINNYIQRQGLMAHDLGPLFSLKTHYCMVTAPECNVLIDAAGRLFACEAMPESMRYGDVKTGFDPEAWKQVTAPCSVREECGQCVFLPQCTEFDRCPNRVAYDACFRQEKRKLETELRFAYAVYQERRRQPRQEDARERKEAPDVSD